MLIVGKVNRSITKGAEVAEQILSESFTVIAYDPVEVAVMLAVVSVIAEPSLVQLNVKLRAGVAVEVMAVLTASPGQYFCGPPLSETLILSRPATTTVVVS